MTLQEVADQAGCSARGLRRALDIAPFRDLVDGVLDGEITLRLAEKELETPVEGSSGAIVDHVYFIQSESGHIKIGHATHPRHRIGEFQIGCPFTLKLLLAVPFPGHGRDIELVLHSALEGSLFRGEWFNPTPEVLDAIEAFRPERTRPKTFIAAIELFYPRDPP